MARRLNYREIAAELAEEIMSGERASGSQLPSYAELAELYDVSVTTAYRAVRILRDDWALIYGEPGRGLYVADSRHWK